MVYTNKTNTIILLLLILIVLILAFIIIIEINYVGTDENTDYIANVVDTEMAYGKPIGMDENISLIYYDNNTVTNFSDLIYIDDEDLNLMFDNYKIFTNEMGYCFKEKFNVEEQLNIFYLSRSNNVKYNSTSVINTCLGTTIFNAHTHPNGVCELSDVDKNAFDNNNIKEYIGIVCGEQNLVVFDNNYERVGVVKIK